MNNPQSLRDEPQFRERQYMSQCRIAGTWCFLDYHSSVKQARVRLGDLGKRGRIIRVLMDVVLPHEVK